MTTTVPLGLRPVYSAQPSKPPVPRIHAEMRDVALSRSDLPRGYGSQFAGWVGGVR
jgi:hypothetical protein